MGKKRSKIDGEIRPSFLSDFSLILSGFGKHFQVKMEQKWIKASIEKLLIFEWLLEGLWAAKWRPRGRQVRPSRVHGER